MNTRLTLIVIILSLACNSFGQSKPKPASVPSKNRYAIESTDTSELLMNEHRFWGIMMEARTASKGVYKDQINSLRRLLFTLEPQEIEQFDNRFADLMERSYDGNLWGAAYVINGGCSDDCFDYFRQYLIAQGKERFYATLKDPESCANWIKSETQEEWEGILYVAGEIYRMKTGREIPASYQPEYVLKGELFNEDFVDKQYPRLAKRFLTRK